MTTQHVVYQGPAASVYVPAAGAFAERGGEPVEVPRDVARSLVRQRPKRWVRVRVEAEGTNEGEKNQQPEQGEEE